MAKKLLNMSTMIYQGIKSQYFALYNFKHFYTLSDQNKFTIFNVGSMFYKVWGIPLKFSKLARVSDEGKFQIPIICQK